MRDSSFRVASKVMVVTKAFKTLFPEEGRTLDKDCTRVSMVSLIGYVFQSYL